MKTHSPICILISCFLFYALNSNCQDKGFTPVQNTNNFNNRIGYKKIALVIGNNQYFDTRNNLKNAKNDAQDISLVLKTLGFEVTTLYDLKKVDFEKAILDYAQILIDAEVGLFYFSGHGFETNGENYLVPSDANLSTPAVYKTCVNLTFLFNNLESAGNATNLIFLDACRSNLKLTTTEAKIKGFTTPDPPSGSLVVYGTKIGKTASDNTSGRNGLFTGTLLKYLNKKELGIRQIVDKTGDDMAELSDGNQLPSRFDIMTTDYMLAKTPFRVDNATKLKHRKLMEEAFRFHNSNSPKQALEVFKKANELIPQDTLSSLYAGMLLWAVNEYEESNKYHLSSLKNGANWYYTYYSISENYRKLKDFKNAVSILKEGIKMNPKADILYQSWRFLIDDIIENKMIEEAIEYSDSYLDLFKNNFEKRSEAISYFFNLFLDFNDDTAKNRAFELQKINLQGWPLNVNTLKELGNYYSKEQTLITNSFQKCDFLKKAKYYYNRAITEYPKHGEVEYFKKELASVEDSINRKCK